MTAVDHAQKVAVIGLGNMGSALAEALLAKGHEITVWNRTAVKCDSLVQAGARRAESLGKAAAEVTIVCVTDHQATLALTGELAAPLRDKLLVQLSTVTADESRALGRWAEERGIDYLDGTIFCYPAGIRTGSGTIVYSGPKALFDAKKALLTAMGGDPQFLSEQVGVAPAFDKAIYSFHYGSMICFLHGAAMSQAAGIPMAAYLEHALAASSGTTTKERMARMVEARAYETDAATIKVEMAAYDHVPKLSGALGIESELPKLIAEIMGRACRAGYTDRDLAAVFEVLIDPGKDKEG